MAETKKSTKSGFSAEERAAMKAAAAERKASQKQQDLDKALAEAIAKLPDDERKMAEKIDAIVREHAPMLASKTYYGDMWPTAFAILKIGPAEERKITALVKKAVS
jgi:hypothetical protein